VNRLIKYIYFLLYLKIANTDDLVYIFLQMILENHDLSNEIMLNQNKLIIYKF